MAQSAFTPSKLARRQTRRRGSASTPVAADPGEFSRDLLLHALKHRGDGWQPHSAIDNNPWSSSAAPALREIVGPTGSLVAGRVEDPRAQSHPADQADLVWAPVPLHIDDADTWLTSVCGQVAPDGCVVLSGLDPASVDVEGLEAKYAHQAAGVFCGIHGIADHASLVRVAASTVPVNGLTPAPQGSFIYDLHFGPVDRFDAGYWAELVDDLEPVLEDIGTGHRRFRDRLIELLTSTPLRVSATAFYCLLHHQPTTDSAEEIQP